MYWTFIVSEVVVVFLVGSIVGMVVYCLVSEHQTKKHKKRRDIVFKRPINLTQGQIDKACKSILLEYVEYMDIDQLVKVEEDMKNTNYLRDRARELIEEKSK